MFWPRDCVWLHFSRGQNIENSTETFATQANYHGMAQMASARPSEREVPGSILGDFNVCFDFPLIRVVIALNLLKTGH